MTTIAHYFSCHRFRGRWVWFVVRKSWLDAELIDVFWGSLVNREFRPFALKLCCFNLMCRWSTISFDSSSALTRLDSSWYIFFFVYSFIFFLSFWELPGSTMQCMILLYYFWQICRSHCFSFVYIAFYLKYEEAISYILEFAICCLFARNVGPSRLIKKHGLQTQGHNQDIQLMLIRPSCPSDCRCLCL